MAILLALAASVAWGTSDFLGGFASRRASLPIVLAGSQLAGFLFFIPILALAGTPFPDDGRLWFGVLAGVIAIAELGLIYEALRRGPVIVIAPVAALGAVIAVVIGVIGGDQLDAVIAVGILCAVAGALGASWAPDDDGHGRISPITIALTGGSALGAGAVLVLLDQASKADPWWAIGAIRVGGALGIAVMLAALLLRTTLRSRPRLPTKTWLVIAAVGIADASADTFYANATTGGALSIVSVLGSLYPVTTIALGAIVLHERPLRIQLAGAALACLGVAILSATGGV